MTTVPFREMHSRERELIHKLLETRFPGRNELLQQMETALVRTIDLDQSIEFSILSSVKANNVKYCIPTEAEYEDPDGMTVHVLLHCASCVAKELEFFREDNKPVQSWPDVSLLRVFAPE